jgi:hypothetical protein
MQRLSEKIITSDYSGKIDAVVYSMRKFDVHINCLIESDISLNPLQCQTRRNLPHFKECGRAKETGNHRIGVAYLSLLKGGFYS